MHLLTKVPKSAMLLKWENMWNWALYYKVIKTCKVLLFWEKDSCFSKKLLSMSYYMSFQNLVGLPNVWI